MVVAMVMMVIVAIIIDAKIAGTTLVMASARPSLELLGLLNNGSIPLNAVVPLLSLPRMNMLFLGPPESYGALLALLPNILLTYALTAILDQSTFLILLALKLCHPMIPLCTQIHESLIT